MLLINSGCIDKTPTAEELNGKIQGAKQIEEHIIKLEKASIDKANAMLKNKEDILVKSVEPYIYKYDGEAKVKLDDNNMYTDSIQGVFTGEIGGHRLYATKLPVGTKVYFDSSGQYLYSEVNHKIKRYKALSIKVK
jgi:hypothetical protein